MMNKSDYQQEIKFTPCFKTVKPTLYKPIRDKKRNPTAKTAKDLERKLLTNTLKQFSNLFTSIPVKLVIEVVNMKLERSKEWKETTNRTMKQVMDLLEIMLNSYFTYDRMHNHQVFGCTMRSLVSAVIADLVICNIEE